MLTSCSPLQSGAASVCLRERSCRTTSACLAASRIHSMSGVLRFCLQHLRLLLNADGRSLLGLLCGLLLPFLGFLVIAADVYERDPFPFDMPLMLAIHASSSGPLDRLAVLLSEFGNTPGMLPLTVVLSVCLYLMQPRATYFLWLALGGSVVLHALLKMVFDRPRPTLWTPILPETDFSFPSGHAMFATSLISALVFLCWPTRWRIPLLVVGSGYVLTMLWARVYSGVHYPTDVLAGTLVALVWVTLLDQLWQAHQRLKPAQLLADLSISAENRG